MRDSGNMCSELLNGEKLEITDSDQNSTMMASNTFDRLLREIQASNLNFHLQVSPFSAHISLKKSLVRERDGTYRQPVLSSISSPCKKNEFPCTKELDELRHNYAEVNKNCAIKTEELVASKKTIATLEAKVAKAEAEIVKMFEEKKSEADIFKKQVKVLQKEIDDRKKNDRRLTKTIKEKDREAVKLQNKCDNLEANVKRLKNEATVLRNENKMLEKESHKKSKFIPSEAQIESITLASTVTAKPTLPSLQNSLLNNNDVPIKVHDEKTPVATDSQSCQPPAGTSSMPQTPPRPLCTPSLHTTPGSQRTPPGFPNNNASVDFMEEEAAVSTSPGAMITVQDKLREVIKKGQKLDFSSVLSLIKNHPWEDSKEIMENDNDDEYNYGDFDNDDYEGYSSEENNIKLEEI